MTRWKQIALLGLAAMGALASGVWLGSWNLAGKGDFGEIDALMTASLPDLEGKPQPLAQWRGKVVVFNFWATWCPPCVEEIPELVRVQEKLGVRGLQIIGIAIDNPQKVREFSAKYRINYPVLVGELDVVDLAGAGGSRVEGLPFTLFLDRQGKLVGTKLGGLNEQAITRLVEPLF